MRLLSAAIAAIPLAVALGFASARAADVSLGRSADARERLAADDGGWRRVEAGRPQVEERITARRRGEQDASMGWRRVHIHEEPVPVSGYGHPGREGKPAGEGHGPSW